MVDAVNKTTETEEHMLARQKRGDDGVAAERARPHLAQRPVIEIVRDGPGRLTLAATSRPAGLPRQSRRIHPWSWSRDPGRH